MNLLKLAYDWTMGDVILIIEIDKYFNCYLIRKYYGIDVYTLIYNTCSYSFPIRINAYLCVFFLYFWGNNFTKGCIPTPHTNFKWFHIRCFGQKQSIIRRCSPIILLVIPRYKKKYIVDLYKDPLCLTPLRSLCGPFSLFYIIELYALYVGHHWEYVCQN